MPAWGAVSRADLIRSLRKAAFDGPFSGKKHPFMTRGKLRLTIPNEKRATIGVNLLAEILRNAGIDRDTWEPSERPSAIASGRSSSRP